TEKAAIAGLNLSMIYYDKGAYEKALDLAVAAVPGLQTSNSLQALGSCFNIIALVYARLSDHVRALEFHHKALATRHDIGNRRGMAQSYNNIANLYKESGNYDSAMVYYHRA